MQMHNAQCTMHNAQSMHSTHDARCRPDHDTAPAEAAAVITDSGVISSRWNVAARRPPRRTTTWSERPISSGRSDDTTTIASPSWRDDRSPHRFPRALPRPRPVSARRAAARVDRSAAIDRAEPSAGCRLRGPPHGCRGAGGLMRSSRTVRAATSCSRAGEVMRPREIARRAASTRFSVMDCAGNSPSRARSSPRSARPCVIASAGLRIVTGAPATMTVPERRPGAAPKSVINNSVRPAPIRPPIPSTSPARTLKLTSSSSSRWASGVDRTSPWPDGRACGSSTVRCLTSSTTAPGAGRGGGNSVSTVRPTIHETTRASSSDAVSALPTVLPSRSTVMRSAMRNTSPRRCDT